MLLFFGGYHLPFVSLTHPEAVGLLPALVKFLVFFNKVILSVVFMMIIRWTIPRIRYDQVLKLGWQSLIPLGITLVVATAIMRHMGWTSPWQLIVMNVVVIALAMIVAPFLPKDDVNRKVPMAGSRFNPLAGETVETKPTDPVALVGRGGLISLRE